MYLIRDILLIFVLVVAGTAAFVYFGGVEIAADVPHSPVVYKLLDATRQRSIELRAADIAPPPLDDPKMIAEGAEHYDAMCAGCHLAPGAADTELRRGLYPQPPKLAEVRVPPGQAFWAIKHGIKLTAMPAWGTTHDNAAIWNIVAFLQKLPGMTADQYHELTAAAAHGEGDHAHVHDAGHDHADHEHADHDHADPAADQHDHDARHDHGSGQDQGGDHAEGAAGAGEQHAHEPPPARAGDPGHR